EAAELLCSIATDPDAVGLRSTAVEAIVELGRNDTAPLIAGLLRDPGRRLCEHSIRLMVEARHVEALPLIRERLSHPTVRVRQAALEAVVRLQDAAAVEQVRWMCRHDPSPVVQPRAIWALAALAGKDAAADLEALASEGPTGPVRAAASTAHAALTDT